MRGNLILPPWKASPERGTFPVMFEIALLALGGVALYLYTRSTPAPAPSGKPEYVSGGNQGWYLIPPYLSMLPKDAFTTPVKVGDFASYWLADGANAKKGEVVSVENSKVVITIQARITGSKTGTGPTGDTYPATIVNAMVVKGSMEDAPTLPPKAGAPVIVARNFAVIAPAGASSSPS